MTSLEIKGDPVTKKPPIGSDMEAKWLGQHDAAPTIVSSGSPGVPSAEREEDERHLKWVGRDGTEQENHDKKLMLRDQASQSLREAWTADQKWETEAATLLQASCSCSYVPMHYQHCVVHRDFKS